MKEDYFTFTIICVNDRGANEYVIFSPEVFISSFFISTFCSFTEFVIFVFAPDTILAVAFLSKEPV